MLRFVIIAAIAAISVGASAQYPYNNGYQYVPNYVPAPPVNHPASDQYRNNAVTTRNNSGSYDYDGSWHEVNENKFAANSAYDPNRNYRRAGTTQQVDKMVWENGRWVHKTGQTWLGASGQEHGVITNSDTQFNADGTKTTTNNTFYHMATVR